MLQLAIDAMKLKAEQDLLRLFSEVPERLPPTTPQTQYTPERARQEFARWLGTK